MENNGLFNAVVRKKRSLTSRRPRPALLLSQFSLLAQCISRSESQRGNHDSSLPPTENTTSRNDDECDLGEETKSLKLKIGCGVTRLLHANASSSTPWPVVVNNNHFHLEVGSSDDCHSALDNKADHEGDTWNAEREEESIMPAGRRKQVEPIVSVRKSKRVPKKRVFHSYDDSDDELQKLNKYKSVSLCNEETQSGRRQLKPPSGNNKKTAEKEETGNEIKRRESTLTSRQRALASSASGKSSAIEFPDGLPPPTTSTTRKKENVSETEQQLNKAEAAQRRKVQVDKAAREAEAEAIRKILGQDSSRKKREDKNKKRLDELAQEKAAHEERAPTSYIRTIMGPNGTTVSFPIDKVPSLFDPKPSGYPPPRENCAGPGCTNPYKYRDSKTRVPLCSLKCYKAVQEQHQTAPPL